MFDYVDTRIHIDTDDMLSFGCPEVCAFCKYSKHIKHNDKDSDWVCFGQKDMPTIGNPLRTTCMDFKPRYEIELKEKEQTDSSRKPNKYEENIKMGNTMVKKHIQDAKVCDNDKGSCCICAFTNPGFGCSENFRLASVRTVVRRLDDGLFERYKDDMICYLYQNGFDYEWHKIQLAERGCCAFCKLCRKTLTKNNEYVYECTKGTDPFIIEFPFNGPSGIVTTCDRYESRQETVEPKNIKTESVTFKKPTEENKMDVNPIKDVKVTKKVFDRDFWIPGDIYVMENIKSDIRFMCVLIDLENDDTRIRVWVNDQGYKVFGTEQIGETFRVTKHITRDSILEYRSRCEKE